MKIRIKIKSVGRGGFCGRGWVVADWDVVGAAAP